MNRCGMGGMPIICLEAEIERLNVRFGSKADMCSALA
jgi:hypothetical protein